MRIPTSPRNLLQVPKAIHAYMKNAKEYGHEDTLFVVRLFEAVLGLCAACLLHACVSFRAWSVGDGAMRWV
jgi:hypothetical protein